MALVPEDGTGLANADTYATAAEARAYALKRGVTLPVAPGGGAPDPVETLLVNAMDYLETLLYIGQPLTTTQSLAWPRKQDTESFSTIVQFRCTPAFPTGVPLKLKSAQSQLCIEQQNSVVLLPSSQGVAQGGGVIIEDTTGPLTTRWSEKFGTTSGAVMPAVKGLLAGLLNTGLASMSLRTVRG